MCRRKFVSLMACLILAFVAGLGAVFFYNTHIFLDGRVYPRNSTHLDLRGTGISADHYAQLTGILPECEIQWDIPFQGSFYTEDTQTLTVQSLTDEDIALLKYFPKLKTLNAMDCGDYAQLAAAKETYPKLDVLYCIQINDESYPRDTRELTISHISLEEIPLLQYLPVLDTVHAEDCTDLSVLQTLREAYPQLCVTWQVPISEDSFPSDTEELTVTEGDLSEIITQLSYLPQLRKVTLIEPVGSPELLLSLPAAFPQIDFFWQKDVFGVPLTSEDTDLDLSGIPIDSLDSLELALAGFPNLETVNLSGCGIDNETLAAFREKMRGDYKVVWSVEVGYLTVRTDDTWFMPGKFKLGVTDEQAYNLRYCEDMICIDVGHKPVSNCEWAAFMPNLKYLILADTNVSDLTPLAGLEHLIYLEIFLTKVTDYSPLVTCTALEDLNLSYTYGDPAPIQKMTWLKRLWWADSPVTVEEFREYLPDAEMMFLHNSSTGNGWRQGQNYYDMREILGMYIMWG